jgi:hypothetical protein
MKSRTYARTLYIVLGALFGALLFVSQIIAAPLPNVELVSLLIIVWTRVYRYGALPGIGVFILLEGLCYGFGIWWVSYLYIWFILWGMVMLVPPMKKARPLAAALGWASLSGVYGLAFGSLTAIPWLFRGGPAAAIAYILSGIPFDITHGVANFVLAFLLAIPLIRLLSKLKSQTGLA